MVLTRELLEQKITNLKLQERQALGRANACGGAVSMLQQLITDLDREEPKEPSDGDPGEGNGTSLPQGQGPSNAQD